jgi:hypothetical protein
MIVAILFIVIGFVPKTLGKSCKLNERTVLLSPRNKRLE